MSLDPAIVFALSLLFLNNLSLGIPKNIQQLVSALVAVGGVWLLVYGAPDDSDDSPDSSTPDNITNTPETTPDITLNRLDIETAEDGSEDDKYILGVLLVCVAAFLSGTYKITYKYFFNDDTAVEIV